MSSTASTLSKERAAGFKGRTLWDREPPFPGPENYVPVRPPTMYLPPRYPATPDRWWGIPLDRSTGLSKYVEWPPTPAAGRSGIPASRTAPPPKLAPLSVRSAAADSAPPASSAPSGHRVSFPPLL
eukprot:EG_transcript_24636